MEMMPFLDGVPLAMAKKGLFTHKAGTVFQLAKLVLNNVTYRFTAGTQGAVALNEGVTNWWFVAPDDRFDFDALASMTAGEFLTALAASCDETPVPAWDEFAVWLSESDTTEQVNALFAAASRVECGGISVASVPEFTAPGEHISGVLRWLLAVLTAVGAADVMQMSEFAVHSRKFSVPLKLYAAGADGTETLMTLVFAFQQ